jgi:hypothetical protein
MTGDGRGNDIRKVQEMSTEMCEKTKTIQTFAVGSEQHIIQKL